MLGDPIFLEVGDLEEVSEHKSSEQRKKKEEKEPKNKNKRKRRGKKRTHPRARAIPLEDSVLGGALAVGDAAAVAGEGVDDAVAVEAGPEAVAGVPAAPALRAVRRHRPRPHFLLAPLLRRRAEQGCLLSAPVSVVSALSPDSWSPSPLGLGIRAACFYLI